MSTCLLGLAVLITLGEPLLIPKTCLCRIDTRTETADCANQNIDAVPDCVPSSTKKLILTNNNFSELHPMQFKRFKALTFVELSENGIRHLNRESFEGLLEIKTLILDLNYLQFLDSNVFLGLSKLQTLSLAVNGLEHLSFNSFRGLSLLCDLDLSDNKLEFLNINLFANMFALTVLSLTWNPLYLNTSLPDDIFKPLTHLEELHLDGICMYNRSYHDNCTYLDVQLSRVPTLKRLYMDVLPNQSLGPGFASLRNLEELRMTSNWYSCTITNKTFENVRVTSLLRLVLRLYVEDTIFPYAFSVLSNLTSLDITYSSWKCMLALKNLTMGLGNTKIKSLKFSGSCRNTKNSVLFSNTLAGTRETNLESLDLSDCSILSVDPDTFLKMPKALKYLNLGRNVIDKLSLGYLKVLNNLIVFDLSNQNPPAFKRINTENVIKGIQSNLNNELSNYRGTEFKYVRDLYENMFPNSSAITSTLQGATETDESASKGIHVVKSTNTPDECLSLPFRLKSIDVGDSALICSVVPCLRNSNNSLTFLKAPNQRQFNCMGDLWKEMQHLTLLEKLDLSSNRIKYLPNDVFFHQRKLKVLVLARNSLMTVSFDIEALKYLETLDISDNTIQYASNQFITKIEMIAKTNNFTIYLQKNQLLCDCDRSEFVAWLRNTQVIFQKDQLNCTFENGSNLSLGHISEIHQMLEMDCIAFQVIIGCVGSFIFLNLSLGLVAVFYYKRWKFRYLLSIGRRNINPYHPLEESRIEMEYDVYISYERDYNVTCNETLHEFVTQKLYSQFKNQGFKVLIREELDAGRRLYDVISWALRRCRKVIVLLSNDYCKDHWNVFEFNLAVMEGIYTKRQVVVPVTFETLYVKALHEDVYSFLYTEPVPRYKSDMDATALLEYLSDMIR